MGKLSENHASVEFFGKQQIAIITTSMLFPTTPNLYATVGKLLMSFFFFFFLVIDRDDSSKCKGQNVRILVENIQKWNYQRNV